MKKKTLVLIFILLGVLLLNAQVSLFKKLEGEWIRIDGNDLYIIWVKDIEEGKVLFYSYRSNGKILIELIYGIYQVGKEEIFCNGIYGKVLGNKVTQNGVILEYKFIDDNTLYIFKDTYIRVKK